MVLVLLQQFHYLLLYVVYMRAYCIMYVHVHVCEFVDNVVCFTAMDITSLLIRIFSLDYDSSSVVNRIQCVIQFNVRN